MGHWTIGRLAKHFGLSRSTLLYYDKLGLLTPSARSAANYRLYTGADVERMELIGLYREAGLPLADIARVLDSEGGALGKLLDARLKKLNEEIHALRRQQRRIVDLLRDDLARRQSRALDKDRWVAILRATGLDDDDLWRWHQEFERLAPEAHQDFLESLGFGDCDVARIRRQSRALEETPDDGAPRSDLRE